MYLKSSTSYLNVILQAFVRVELKLKQNFYKLQGNINFQRHEQT